MTNSKRNNGIEVTNTVSAINAPESNFQALADRAGNYVDLIEEDEEGMIPHN